MQFQCPQCKAILASDAVTNGMQVTCPECKAQIEAQPYVENAATMASSADRSPINLDTPQHVKGSEGMIRISCPYCSNIIQTNQVAQGQYADCPSCGKRFRVQSELATSVSEENHGKLSMTTALVFQAINIGGLAIAELIKLANDYDPYDYEDLLVVISFLTFVPAILNLIFSAILHYKCWKTIPAEFARMTPGKAIGYLFIPCFNFYWAFPSFAGLGSDCVAFAKCRGLKRYNHLGAFGLTLAILYVLSSISSSFSAFSPIPIVGFLLAVAYFVIWLLFYQGVTRLLSRVALKPDTMQSNG